MVSKTNHVFLSCKDHTVSGEEFELRWNKEKDVLITHPQPALQKLPSYYKSEAYISHTDASTSLVDKMYQSVKKIMLKRKINLLASFSTKGKTLLDIGAGTGDFLKVAQKNKWKVSGAEPNEKARSLAKEKGISLEEDLHSFQPISFDVISMWHVLEHVPNLEEQIQQLYSLLKKEGYLFIAVPNFKSFDADYYKEFWAAFDVPRHLWHFSQSGMKRIFEAHQFQLIETFPLWFDAFYVSMLSEKYKAKKNNASHLKNLIKAFRIGLKSNLKAKHSSEYSSLVYVFKKH